MVCQFVPAAPIVTDCALVQHLLSGPRLPFTAAYFGSIALTLYFSIGVSDRPLSELGGLPLLEMAYPCARHLPSTPLASPFLKYQSSFRELCHLEMRHH
jgi:hypothetical protein